MNKIEATCIVTGILFLDKSTSAGWLIQIVAWVRCN